jgi:hypothetical protein
VFGDVWSFITARIATIGQFIVADEGEATGWFRKGAKAIDVVANLVFLALLLVLAWRGIDAIWSGMASQGVATQFQRNAARDPKHYLMLGFIILVAIAALLLVIELLFRLRAIAGPNKLLVLFAIFQVGEVIHMVLFDWPPADWDEVLAALFE